jgi:hypothetical protein
MNMEREWSREMFRMSCERAISRREFLRLTAGTGTAAAMFFASPLRAAALPPASKTIVVTFGGGARDEETFAPEGQRYIPRLLAELIPQATFYTLVVNRGILGHYVANAGLATGCYETFDNFMPIAPRNPTIFESPTRRNLLQYMVAARSSGSVGPEELRSRMMQMVPTQLGNSQAGSDEVLRRFELSVLTEGAAPQIFSTTFAQ